MGPSIHLFAAINYLIIINICPGLSRARTSGELIGRSRPSPGTGKMADLVIYWRIMTLCNRGQFMKNGLYVGR